MLKDTFNYLENWHWVTEGSFNNLVDKHVLSASKCCIVQSAANIKEIQKWLLLSRSSTKNCLLYVNHLYFNFKNCLLYVLYKCLINFHDIFPRVMVHFIPRLILVSHFINLSFLFAHCYLATRMFILMMIKFRFLHHTWFDFMCLMIRSLQRVSLEIIKFFYLLTFWSLFLFPAFLPEGGKAKMTSNNPWVFLRLQWPPTMHLWWKLALEFIPTKAFKPNLGSSFLLQFCFLIFYSIPYLFLYSFLYSIPDSFFLSFCALLDSCFHQKMEME